MKTRINILIVAIALLGVMVYASFAISWVKTSEGIKLLQCREIVGMKLQQLVVARAEGIMAVNRPYRGNGVIDCYGYIRQVWNPLLSEGSNHSEEFNTTSYTQSRMFSWIIQTNGLPVADYTSSNWAAISSIGLNNLKPGDVVGSVQGHRKGTDVRYGLYAGKSGSTHYQYDCSRDGGASKRNWSGGFKYYYKPTHKLLAMDPPTENRTKKVVADGFNGDGTSDLVNISPDTSGS